MNNTIKSVINQSSKRRENILSNQPAIFDLQDNPRADIYKGEILERLPGAHKMGVDAVNQNLNLIIKESQKQKVDPNLVAAVFYMENSHGYYGGIGPLADRIGESKSALPGNIRPMWNKLAGENGDVRKLEDNIKASVTLIKRISERVENPTVERIGTLYNSLSQEKVTNYGARLGEIFRTHKWGRQIQTDNHMKSNIVEENVQGFKVTIPNDKKNEVHHIKDFVSTEKTFLEKALEHANFQSLTNIDQMKFLSAAYLLDEKQATQSSIHPFGISPTLKAEIDADMQERQKNQKNQGRSLA